MLCKALKAFTYGNDGVTAHRAEIGDLVDLSEEMARSLEEAGYVESDVPGIENKEPAVTAKKAGKAAKENKDAGASPENKSA